MSIYFVFYDNYMSYRIMQYLLGNGKILKAGFGSNNDERRKQNAQNARGLGRRNAPKACSSNRRREERAKRPEGRKRSARNAPKAAVLNETAREGV